MQRGRWDRLSSRLIGTAQRGERRRRCCCERRRAFKASQPSTVRGFDPFHLALLLQFTKKTQNPSHVSQTELHTTQWYFMWGLRVRAIWGAYHQGCRWLCLLDKCHHLPTFLPLFSWDMGAWRTARGCYIKKKKNVDGRRRTGSCFMWGPSVFSLGWIQPADVVESELNHITAEGLQRSL